MHPISSETCQSRRLSNWVTAFTSNSKTVSLTSLNNNTLYTARTVENTGTMLLENGSHYRASELIP